MSPIDGITGKTVLSGAVQVGLVTSNAPINIVFAPPVNRVSFDALDLDNATGLSVMLFDAGGKLIASDQPAATNRIVHYARSSGTPIARVTIAYAPLILADGWFIDQLTFKAWICGDGVLDNDPSNPAREACDDGNKVQCDGCSTSCQVTSAGCYDGTTCVPNGTTVGCKVCNTATPADANGNIGLSNGSVGAACDDSLFCTLPGTCDANGVCQQQPNLCSDGIVCTADSCDEAHDACLHSVEPDWCLIGGTCYADGSPNPASSCETCSAQKNNAAWDTRPSGTQCSDPICANGIQTAASLCDPSGNCQVGASTQCQFMTCANTVTCDGHCQGDIQCPRQAYCDTLSTNCMSDLPAGSPCTRSGQCTTNQCVDGVCCDKSCDGACQACNQKNKVGICSPLPAMSVDPENRCGPMQYCSATGACTLPPIILMDGGILMTPPSLDSGTPSGMRPMGSACDSNTQCGSGICSDGVCCNQVCNGVCESCAVAGEPVGQCLPIALGDDPGNECTGPGAVCSGERSCTSFETRGNGLCAAAPGSHQGALALGALAALATLLASRRKRAAA